MMEPVKAGSMPSRGPRCPGEPGQGTAEQDQEPAPPIPNGGGATRQTGTAATMNGIEVALPLITAKTSTAIRAMPTSMASRLGSGVD